MIQIMALWCIERVSSVQCPIQSDGVGVKDGIILFLVRLDVGGIMLQDASVWLRWLFFDSWFFGLPHAREMLWDVQH